MIITTYFLLFSLVKIFIGLGFCFIKLNDYFSFFCAVIEIYQTWTQIGQDIDGESLNEIFVR